MAEARIGAEGPAPSGRIGAGYARILVAIVVPIALVLAAVGLTWDINQLRPEWPIDPAVFGWLVIVPTWLSAPIVASYLWRPLSRWQTWSVAAGIGGLVSGGAALLFWQSIGTPFDCGFGTVTPAVDFLPQTIFVGLVVGGGLALSSLLGAQLTRFGVHWWWIILVVGGCEFVLLGFAGFVAYAAAGGHICYVPGPNYPVTR